MIGWELKNASLRDNPYRHTKGPLHPKGGIRCRNSARICKNLNTTQQQTRQFYKRENGLEGKIPPNPLKRLVGAQGLEPWTRCLKGRCHFNDINDLQIKSAKLFRPNTEPVFYLITRKMVHFGVPETT